jgi:asparagine synthase (glutamine-hydrolysing)
MCGICGMARARGGNPLSSAVLSSMTKSLLHRGPDDEGYYLKNDVALAVRRLSVIDPEGGHQPLSNEGRSIWIVHNGEIYNFCSLRKELLSRGHSFSTRSDTETIVHSYEEWGEEGIEKLRGMFAFALWNSRQRRLLLVRDRIGIKPLYYTLLEDRTLIFGSELKAIISHPRVKRIMEPEALDLYLTLEYIPSPFSIYKNVFKLPPGCFLIFEDGQIEIKRYWNPNLSSQGETVGASLSTLKEKLYSLLEESVKLNLISDVPLGAFLSGGMDSSTIVSFMQELGFSPLKTFSIGFEEASYNELEHARRIARRFHTDHQEYILKPSILNLAQKLILHLDEPLADFSIFPTYLVSKMARSEVKVILSGDGGDELFGGYEHYQAQILSRQPTLSHLGKGLMPFVKKLPPARMKKGLWNRLRRFCMGFEHIPKLRHLRWMMFFSLEEKRRLYSDSLNNQLGELKEVDETEPFRSLFPLLSHLDQINGELFLDLKTYLADDLLVKIDRMSMAASLETRVPFLDHRLVEFVISLPGNLKIRGLTLKWLLKKTMKGRLPQQTLHRSKEGFSIPIKHWLRKELKNLLLDYLSKERIKEGGLFHFNPIEEMIDAHLKGKENYSHQLWALMVFEMWKEHYL